MKTPSPSHADPARTGSFPGLLRNRNRWTGRLDDDRGAILWFALTTLLSAFLIFQVQPVISKSVLPWFGGTPAVWTTCLLFFQVLLFAGYAYAHLSRTLLSPRCQGLLHLVLLVAAAMCLPIEPTAVWKPTGQEQPTTHLLALLAVHVGLPYFVLSSTGPLIQAWMSYRDSSDRVYRLYALSNVGSLSALLSYPFLIEPWISVTGQSVVWSLLFCLFVLAEGALAVRLLGGDRDRGEGTSKSAAPPSQAIGPRESGDRDVPTCRISRVNPMVAWVGLPALASVCLLVVTNHICQDVAVIPFLWVVPLSLYLLSFIICFDSPAWYRPKPIAVMTLSALVLAQCGGCVSGPARLVLQTLGDVGLLLGICLLCHGEAARLKPNADRLTLFYLCLSGGGAIGGVLVAVIFPVLFRSYLELPLMMGLGTAGTLAVLLACRDWGPAERWNVSGYDWTRAFKFRFGLLALVIAPLAVMAVAPQDEVVQSSRNFFGVLRVTRDASTTNLIHGSTIHGMQRFGEAADEPTSYYGRQSGVGRAIQSMQASDESLSIGVVGLGCGVLAAYGRAADVYDMIEINPDVVSMARRHFTFLSRSPATQNVHLGDGRLVLERMRDARFDLLVLDAFSSDAIPAHLLTREAFELYRKRLVHRGVIAVHVSNNHLDLVPLVHRLAEVTGFESREIHSAGNPATATKQAKWILVGRTEAGIWSDDRIRDASRPKQTPEPGPLWTDQHHNLASVLKLW